MSRVYLPATNADQWSALLAEPTKQWKTGYSARTLAHCWQDADGFPTEVKAALMTSSALAHADLLLALPEHQVPLLGGARPSQNDIWILAKARGELVSMAVEGKVREPFGPTIGEWLGEPSEGKLQRLAFLQAELGLVERPPLSVRYQLLHRTASATIEATRFGAKHALMLVHSFSQEHLWFDDFSAFATLLGVKPEIGTIASAGQVGGIHLHLGWVTGDSAYLLR